MNRPSVGVGLALVTALISGIAVYLNAHAVKQVPDAAVYTTLKNAIAAGLLLLPVLALTSRDRVRAVDRRSWLGVVVVGIFGGGLAFLLFFSGLALASAPSAAFIHKTLFVWVALLAVPVLGERLGLVQVGALATLLGAQLLIAQPSGVTWGIGETLIAAATLLWSMEVILARRLLQRVPATLLGAARLGVGLVLLGGYLLLTGRLPLVAQLDGGQWLWVLATGVLLAGYVATWFAALARAPATLVASVLVLGAPITAALTAVANGTLPAPPQLAGHAVLTAAAAAIAAYWLWQARRPAAARAGMPATAA